MRTNFVLRAFAAAPLLALAAACCAQPRIGVSFGPASIPDGSNSPALQNGTAYFATSLVTHLPATHTIHNFGTQDLQVTTITLTGAGAAKFAVFTAQSGPLPTTISPGGIFNFDVDFNANSVGFFNAELRISSNDPNVATYDYDLAVGAVNTGVQSPDLFVTSEVKPKTALNAKTGIARTSAKLTVSNNGFGVSNGVFISIHKPDADGLIDVFEAPLASFQFAKVIGPREIDTFNFSPASIKMSVLTDDVPGELWAVTKVGVTGAGGDFQFINNFTRIFGPEQ